jgi:transposase
VDRKSRPKALEVYSANPAEIKLLPLTLEHKLIATKMRRIVGDGGYESDQMDKALQAQGIELIAPHAKNRIKHTQDKRALRHQKHRWVVERFFSWLQNFRRCVVRYERYLENFQAFVHLAAIMMYLHPF